MNNWSCDAEGRNYSIERKIDRRHFWELIALTLSILIIAVALFCHMWVRSRIVGIGYEALRLQEEERVLTQKRHSLVLEEETLKDPQRIERIAHTRLQMIRRRPNQLLPPGLSDLDYDRSGRLAMMKDLKSGTEPQKISAAN